jgi:hypothetical protein
VILRRRLVDIDARRIAVSVVRIVVAAIAMGAVLVPFANYFAARGALFVAGVGCALGAAVYFSLTLAMRSEEVTFVLRRLKKS